MSLPSEGPPEDDFSAMLKRVRAASGSDTPPPPKSRDPRKVTKSSGSSIVTTGGLVAIAVIFFLGMFGIVRLSVWSLSRIVSQSAGVSSSPFVRRSLQQKRLDRYRVPVDSTITPVEAGNLAHAINRAGFEGDLLPWERAVEPKLGVATCCLQFTRAASLQFEPRLDWTITSFAHARRGFTPEQRGFLRDVAQSPPLAAFRRLARAREADLGAGLWEVPADSEISYTELPVIRSELRTVAASNIAGAALDLEAGRVASAEQRLREVISVGFVLERNARTTYDEIIGSSLVNFGRLALESFLNAVGRKDEATFVSAKSDSAIPRGPGNAPRVPVDELRETLRRRILDSTESIGIRWQLLLGPFAYLPCTSVSQAIFGPNARHRADLKEFHDVLVKYPSDERRFTMHTRGFIQLIDPASRSRPSPGRAPWGESASRITGSRQLEMCGSLWRR